MEKFITGEIDGTRYSAFVTSNKPPCENGGEHQWDGEEIMSFHNDDRILKRSEFAALPKAEQEKLNIQSGQVSCSKCGIGAMEWDNPYYSEE
jgi:hypothetical protein